MSNDGADEKLHELSQGLRDIAKRMEDDTLNFRQSVLDDVLTLRAQLRQSILKMQDQIAKTRKELQDGADE